MKIFYCVLIILISAIVGYLFGAIPNAVIIGKLFYGKDPRLEGSKNPGGTNAGRVLGKKAGISVIALDGLKIVIPFLTAYLIFTKIPLFKDLLFYDDTINALGRGNTIHQLAYWIVPMFGVIGHCYSVYIKFAGGKAVSSFMGFSICCSWISWITFSCAFFGILKKKKHVSSASIVSTGLFVIETWIFYIIYACYGLDVANYLMYFGFGPEICIYFPLFITFSYLILILKHRENIKRLKEGTERTTSWMIK